MKTEIHFFEGSIPVCFASNEYFVPYMASMMQSIMENSNPKRRFAFYVLHADISEESMSKLQKQISVFENFTIDFVEAGKYFENYTLYVHSCFSVEIYFRLIIPYIFEKYDKVLYFDGDMISVTDVSELYDMEMGNNLVTAVPDNYHKSNVEELETLRKKGSYFNTGMLVINAAEFRKSFSFQQIMELASSQKLEFPDQDLLNVLCKDRTILVSRKWNFILAEKTGNYQESEKDDYQAAGATPNIIHYTGTKKPWKSHYNLPFFWHFWCYADRTPFIDVIIERMEQQHLIWHYQPFLYEKVKFEVDRAGGGNTKKILKFALSLCNLLKRN